MNEGLRSLLCRLTLLAGILHGATAPHSAAAQDETTDGIIARMEFDRLRLYSGVGVNLAERLQLARRQVEAMAGAGPFPGSVVSSRWRSLGPDRTDDFGWDTSGRVSAIAIHPRNPNTIYIGAAQGGVWRTDDAGASWRPLTDSECSLAMGSIAIDPVNPEIIYAGTGEQHFSGDSYYGCGVLRSTNGGITWEQLGSSVFQRQGWGGTRISRVHIDPSSAGTTNATVVMVASTYGLFRSENSGRTWRTVLDGVVTDLVMRPGDPALLYAALRRDRRDARDKPVIYRSMDGGVSWISVSPAFPEHAEVGRVNLAVAPSDPDVLYASIYDRSEDARREGLLMYRSDDGADTWTHVEATGASCHRQCWYDMTLAVHPEDADRVNLGTLLLYLSEDGGRTFREFHPEDTYVDQHLMVFDTLTGPDVLYLANDGGVYRSMDAGATYTSLSTNLAITQFYSGIALHPLDPAVTLGGTQDQGTQRSAAGTTIWTKVMGGDGGFTAFDAEDPSIWYGEYQLDQPRRNGEFVGMGINEDDERLFIPPFVMDPIDSRRLYFGTTRLYRTDDRAETWVPVFEGDGRSRISAIAPSASDPDVVYIGLSYARSGPMVFATRDGGATWSGQEGSLPSRYVGDLAVHPTDPDQAYAVVGGFGTGHVFETTDGGETWEDRSGNLPDMPVNAVLYDPADPAGVYIGTDLGVFYSARGGGIWSPLDDAFPMVAVFDLAAQPGTGRLVAATHGRGMFEIPIDIPLLASTRPGTVADTAFAATDTSFGGTVIVAPRGRGDYGAPWTARTADQPWLSVADGAGVGRGRFDYTIATGADLLPGDHKGTITVDVAGTDPVVIPVELRARYWSTIAAARTGSKRSLPMGHGEAVTDSVDVEFDGPRAALTPWSATRSGPGWADLVQASGTGDGTVTWTGDVSELGVGLYVDTILISGPLAAESPVAFLDSLSVEPPLALIALHMADGLGVAGLARAQGDSLSVGLSGFGAESAVWFAESGGSWLELEQTAGGRSDPIVWNRSAAALEAGIHEDTIRIGVRDHPHLHGLIVDRFDVQDPIGVDAAALQLLGQEHLADAQVRFLEWFGNQDGKFNAGDVLRWLHHCAAPDAGGTGGGCAPTSAPAPRTVSDSAGRRP